MRVELDDIGIEVAVHGPPGGQPVLLLHGFPDSARVWRLQVPTLVEAGFRVVVPDLRGYGGSDKPISVQAYAVRHLLADAIGLLDNLGVERTHVVGHDWGATVAWGLATFAPQRVDHLVVLSVGHPTSLRAAGLEQKWKSGYMLLFLLKGVAERGLSYNGWANFRRRAKHPDADAVIADLETNGSLTPALNYYRANVPARWWLKAPTEYPPVQAPTMGVWGSDDPALAEAQMAGSAGHVAGPWRYERLDGVGHWLQLEAPDVVNRLLINFFGDVAKA